MLRFARRIGGWLDARLGLVFVIPGIAIIVVLLIYPISVTILNSFTNMSFLRPEIAKYIGLRNYLWAIRAPEFWNALKVSVFWTAGTVGTQFLVGMVTALALDTVKRFRLVFRLALLIPWAFPSIAVSLTWKWMFDARFGIVNVVLRSLGIIQERVAWLSAPGLALPVVIAMGLWFGFPFMMLTFLAGLQTIPEDYYDVARLEGASYAQQLRYFILPSLRRIIGITLVLRTIWMFNNFDLIFLSTGGGPGIRTETLPIYAYNITWKQMSLGRGSALNVILLIVLILCIILYFRTLRLERE